MGDRVSRPTCWGNTRLLHRLNVFFDVNSVLDTLVHLES